MMLEERPYTLINVAMSLDGKTDTIHRRGTSISSPLDRERVDRLRADCDAVMVGGRTLLDEDPRLTVKSPVLQAQRLAQGLPAQPAKVGVVSKADLRPESRFLSDGPAQVFIFTTHQTDPAQIDFLRQRGVQVFVMEGPRVDLPAAMRQLRQVGIQRLLVEGGGTLNDAMLRQGLVDEIRVYVAPLIFAGECAPTFAGGPGLPRHAALPLQLTHLEQHDDGGLVLYYRVGLP